MYHYTKEYTDGIIYRYTNKINGKVYIGQTVNENRRKREHCLAKDDCPFHNAIRKYGFKNFQYKVLFRVHCRNQQDLVNTLNSKEINCIKFFKSTQREFGYNVTAGGEGYAVDEKQRKKISQRVSGKGNPMYGKHHTKEVREKLSRLNKGKKMPPGFSERQSELHKGISFTEEHRKNLSKSLKGMVFSEEHKKNISISKKGKPNLTNASPVVQFSMEGNYIAEFISIRLAEKSTGVSEANIRVCCCKARAGNNNISAGNYIWRYKSNWDGNNVQPVKKFRDRAVLKIDINSGEILEEYKNPTEASKANNLNISTLCIYIKKGKSLGGYNWRYKDDK